MAVVLFVTKWQIIDILSDASRHEAPNLSIGAALVMFVPLFAAYGLSLLLIGQPSAEFAFRVNQSIARGPFKWHPLVNFMLVLGIGLLGGLLYELHQLGYSLGAMTPDR